MIRPKNLCQTSTWLKLRQKELINELQTVIHSVKSNHQDESQRCKTEELILENKYSHCNVSLVSIQHHFELKVSKLKHAKLYKTVH